MTNTGIIHPRSTWDLYCVWMNTNGFIRVNQTWQLPLQWLRSEIIQSSSARELYHWKMINTFYYLSYIQTTKAMQNANLIQNHQSGQLKIRIRVIWFSVLRQWQPCHSITPHLSALSWDLMVGALGKHLTPGGIQSSQLRAAVKSTLCIRASPSLTLQTQKQPRYTGTVKGFISQTNSAQPVTSRVF